jgi:type 1 fimbria pilin
VNRNLFPSLALAAALFAPAAVLAASTVDASLIPDGTYTVKVERVVDSKHVTVVMDNGTETTLPAGRPTVDFSKVQPNDQLKLSLIKGSVMVFADLTSH